MSGNQGVVLAAKYRLDEKIGEGAMGEVWRATQLGLDRKVAIKLLAGVGSRHADARIRFTREAKVAASLQHPGIVSVLDFGISDQVMYLVMELLVGRTLRDRIDAGPIPIHEVGIIGAEIAVAMIAAHRINLVHRDLKPENIFLETVGDLERVRIVDFGLAFIDNEDGSLGRLTHDDVLSGTPQYMSPEQVTGKSIGPASDVYSFGNVLYELFTGSAPFTGSVVLLLTRQAYEAPESMRRAAPQRSIDPLLDELVLAMLSKSPLLRPTLEHVKTTLEKFTGGNTSRIGRSGIGLGDRSSRMVGSPDTTAPSPTARTIKHEAPGILVPTGAFTVSWLGTWDDELALGLAANEIDPRRGDPTPHGVVYAPGQSIPDLARLAAGGARVITDVALDDVPGIAECLRAGVHDVVTRPVRPEDLARKLRRAIEDRHR